MFHVLPLPALDRLAGLVDPVTVAGGDAVVQQGDAGDRFYVVDEGEVEVLVDGDHVRTLGPGEAFGEIALLRDVPRTATVRAVEPTRLLALDRQEFLAAVTGHAGTARAADGLVRAQLARRAPAAAVVA
jgi:CRP-like cAMP-binding protein